MTLLFIDGFDHLSGADSGLKYEASTLTQAAVGDSSPATRHGSGKWISTGNSTGTRWQKTITAGASFVMGCGLYINSHAAAILLRLLDSGTAQVELRLQADGTLRVTRNNNTVTGGDSTYVVPTATWVHLEWKVTIADSIGANSCKVRINGVDVITVATGQDLKNTANASANAVVIAGAGGLQNCLYDDFYICNQSGSVNNDFLGDVKVLTILPDGAGNTTQWTPSAGSNYQNVDDNPSDGDTTYNSEDTANDKDTYTLSNISLTGTILGVQTNIVARKDDAGARTLAPVVRSNGADYDGSTVSINNSYTDHVEIRETDPDTSAAWTVSAINALEAGMKLIS